MPIRGPMFGRGMIYWRLTLCSGSEWECGGGGGVISTYTPALPTIFFLYKYYAFQFCSVLFRNGLNESQILLVYLYIFYNLSSFMNNFTYVLLA